VKLGLEGLILFWNVALTQLY